VLDLVAHLIAWCQSCVPDAQSAAPAVGIIGGTAGAIGAIGGLGGGLGSADASAASGGETASSPTGGNAPPGDGDTATGGDTSTSGGGDGADGGDDSKGLSEPPSSFNDTTGGFQMHEPPDPPEFPDDPFHSPSANPQPIFSDGSQVDGSNKPGDDTTETDYINPDGTPLGSTPAAPHHTPATPPHKPK
jgi:hypothetical protein